MQIELCTCFYILITLALPGCSDRSGSQESDPAQSSVTMPTEEPPTMIGIGEHTIELLQVDPGKFTMGNEDWKLRRTLEFLSATPAGSNEGPPHMVEITYPFWISKEPISAELFSEFLNEQDSELALREFISLNEFANFELRDGRFLARQELTHRYANTVSHAGAVAFSEWLGDRVSFQVRLPYEAEWEYARETRGAELSHGLNLWEHCLDYYTKQYHPDGDVTINPKGPASPELFVQNGLPAFVRRHPEEPVQQRLPANHRPPIHDAGVIGFRIVVLPREQPTTSSD